MKYTIRKINNTDYKALITLFTEFAAFEKTPDKMTNSIEKMEAEKELMKSYALPKQTIAIK